MGFPLLLLVLSTILLASPFNCLAETSEGLRVTDITSETQLPEASSTTIEIGDEEECTEIQNASAAEFTKQREPGICFSSGLLPALPKKSVASTEQSYSTAQVAESIVLAETKAKLPGEDLLDDLFKRCLGLTDGISVVPQLPIPGICNIDLKKCDKACTLVPEDKIPPGYYVAASCGSTKSLGDSELDTSCHLVKSSACGDNEPTEIYVHQNSKQSCQSPAGTSVSSEEFDKKMGEAIDQGKCVGFLAKGGYWANLCRQRVAFLSRLRFGDTTHSCEDILKDSSKPYKRLVIACDSEESAERVRGQLDSGNGNVNDPARRDACMKLGGATGINRCVSAKN